MRIPAVVAMTLAVLATAANANPTSYVASYGNDANACQLATPCRSFTAALAQTQLNGQIVALDVAGYGPVTINQPVTLTAARGIYAAITGSTGAAVTIDAVGSVVLRGLTLTGLGAAQGIAVVNSTDVTIDHCTIAGFAADGIALGSGATGNVVIRDTSIDHSGTSAIAINNAVSARVLVDRADIAASGLASVAPGISFVGGGNLTIHDTVISTGTGYGVYASTGGPAGALLVERSMLFRNGSGGASAAGANLTLTVVDSTIADNLANGISADTNATVVVSGNQVLRNRTGPGFVNNAATFASFVNNAVDLNNGGGAQTSGTITFAVLQ